MAKKSTKVNHKQLNDSAYSDKFNECVSYLPKDPNKFEHNIGNTVRYIGGIWTKNSLCKITKQVDNKSILYYSVIFEGTDKEVNWIKAHLLKKVEVEGENINIEEENNND